MAAPLALLYVVSFALEATCEETRLWELVECGDGCCVSVVIDVHYPSRRGRRRSLARLLGREMSSSID